MSATYKTHWDRLLSRQGTQAIDMIASIKEDTLNEFLKSHFKYDNAHYTLPITRTFNANGTPRTFVLTVKIEAPIKIDLPPFTRPPLFTPMTAGHWTALEHRAVVHRIPRENDPIPNIRINCPKLSFKIEWEKLNGTGNWELNIGSLEAVAEGFLEVISKREGSFLKIHPTKICFDKADTSFSENISAALGSADVALRSEVNEKFRDLAVILLNIAVTEAAPNFIREILIPTLTIKDKDITVSYLNMEENILTIGATLDAIALRAEASLFCSKNLSYFSVILNEDIEESGGMKAFFDAKGNILPDADIKKKLPRAMNFIKKLEKANVIQKSPKREIDISRFGSKVSEGMAIGINEYFFDTVANASLPAPTNDCTDWKEFAGAVRGRACWWSRIANADTNITDTGSGFKLSGSVAVDVGGALEGCVRKFWDCSWHWACERIGLALKGRPEISIRLEDDGDGILFVAKIERMPELDADLPFPFNKVIEFFGHVILASFRVVFNLILSQIKLRVIPEDIAIPVEGHHTGLHLSAFDAFYYKRPSAPFAGQAPANKLLFGCYAVSVEPRQI